MFDGEIMKTKNSLYKILDIETFRPRQSSRQIPKQSPRQSPGQSCT